MLDLKTIIERKGRFYKISTVRLQYPFAHESPEYETFVFPCNPNGVVAGQEEFSRWYDDEKSAREGHDSLVQTFDLTKE